MPTMDEDATHHPDRSLNEPQEMSHNQRERSASLAQGQNGGDDVTGNGNAVDSPTGLVDPNAKAVEDVVNSEIGVSTLLNRLKQSLASAKEFASFLQKRSKLEEEHSNGLKKLCRSTSENIRRPDHRHGSFLQSYEETNIIHERMAKAGEDFSISLHAMYEELLEMATNIERGRKQWKTTGLASEARAADAEAAMRKSKAKYDGLAEDYDRARTGDGQSGKKFGLKGPKSAQQHEADLLRKLQAADADYQAKVTAAQGLRSELLARLRPDAVKNLQELIRECDSALTLQMQKYASFNEKLLLSVGLNVSPLKHGESKARSLREVVHAIDNEKDLSNYLGSFANKVGRQNAEIKYERHPVLSPSGISAPTPQRQADPSASFGSRQGPPPSSFPVTQQSTAPAHQTHASQPFNNQQTPVSGPQQHERSFSQGPSGYGSLGGPPRTQGGPPASNYNSGSISSSGPPQISTLPFQTSSSDSPSSYQPPQQQSSFSSQQPQQHYPSQPLMGNQNSYTQSPISASGANQPGGQGHLPPVRPVFGLTLEQLFDRDQSAVPLVVYQCIQAVDLYGIEAEGIYRLSGTASHIAALKAMFDNDASSVDFRNPENFFHDVNSVAGLLKQFFRDLPDPLLTVEHYAGFIEAAKNDDDIIRRDSLHAIINSLPDPNYATLRALTLHLHRVVEASPQNRMNASNVAIVFGPTLMGASTGPNIQDAGWQVRVIDTILQNTYQIFDDDD